MHLLTAIAAVRRDQRESYPYMTSTQAVEHVQCTMTIADLDINDAYEAYHMVLAAAGERLVTALRATDPVLELIEMATTLGLVLTREDVVSSDGELSIDGMTTEDWFEAMLA
jgi:hypothetical protein